MHEPVISRSNSPFFLSEIELILFIIANLQHKSMRTSRIDRCEPRYAGRSSRTVDTTAADGPAAQGAQVIFLKISEWDVFHIYIYIFNTTATDGLATHVARASAVMVLTYFSSNMSSLGTDWVNFWVFDFQSLCMCVLPSRGLHS